MPICPVNGRTSQMLSRRRQGLRSEDSVFDDSRATSALDLSGAERITWLGESVLVLRAQFLKHGLSLGKLSMGLVFVHERGPGPVPKLFFCQLRSEASERRAHPALIFAIPGAVARGETGF